MFHQHRVVGVQYQQAIRCQRLGDDEFHFGQIVQRVDAVFAEMVGADVRHHRDARVVGDQPAPQQAAARGFQHRRLHPRIAQHRARADRPGIIAGLDASRHR